MRQQLTMAVGGSSVAGYWARRVWRMEHRLLVGLSENDRRSVLARMSRRSFRRHDTLFHEGARETYDAAICMYHDQALIPIKTLAFWSGVNVTLGLPIVRTSPDHGTALDIAGRGTANAESMIAAIEMAAEIATRRGK